MRFRLPVLTLFLALAIVSSIVMVKAISIYAQAPSPAPSAAATVAETEQILKQKLDAYTERADGLQKLISLLLGLSTIYAIALAFSAYTSVKTNIEQSQKSVDKLETLLKELPSQLDDIQQRTAYSTKITMASGSLALALQAKYLTDAELAIDALRELRSGKHATDRYVNLLLGRLYKTLRRFENAEETMTSFIQRKEQAGEGDDSSIADAYYNRACYQSLRWNQATSAQKTALQSGIERDLTRTFRLDQTYRRDAANDDDFAAVKGEAWFATLTS
ncbi:MAG TPA: hypothetical protein VJT50_13015 [Pyrinomonadaceae bacterium]|nr:hypothetical protein [Pyrinomonadaceae bacterium]